MGERIDTICEGEAQRLFDEGVEKIQEVLKQYVDEYDDEGPTWGTSGVKATIHLAIAFDLDPIRGLGDVEVTSSVKLPKPRPKRQTIEVTRDGIGVPDRRQLSMFEAIEAQLRAEGVSMRVERVRQAAQTDAE